MCWAREGTIHPIDFSLSLFFFFLLLWCTKENTVFIWRFLPKANHIKKDLKRAYRTNDLLTQPLPEVGIPAGKCKSPTAPEWTISGSSCSFTSDKGEGSQTGPQQNGHQEKENLFPSFFRSNDAKAKSGAQCPHKLTSSPPSLFLSVLPSSAHSWACQGFLMTNTNQLALLSQGQE